MSETAIPDGVTQPHPEAQHGEVWLCNCPRSEPQEFDDIDYQTKRAGRVAFDVHGNVIPDYFPVFVWRVEHNIHHKEVKVGQ